jgi:protein-L-isoaspartate O-methyltransferase
MLPTLDRPTALEHYKDLADELRRNGKLSTDAWISAFEATPRATFLGSFAVREPVSGAWTTYDLHASDPADRAMALTLARTDLELVIQFDRAQVPTSSCPQPSVVATLLEALDVQEHHRVLQIGTGTGYTAALLCQRVGADNVTTVELHRELAASATRHLAVLGHHPRVLIGDGRRGAADHGPYDRLIATCSTPRIPVAWINQVRPGGVIIANLGSGFVRLVVAPDKTASGFFLPLHGTFTTLRDNDTDSAATTTDLLNLIANNAVVRRTVKIPHGLTHPMITLLITLHHPDLHRVIQHLDHGVRHVLISPADGFADVRVDYTDRAPTHDRGLLTEPEGSPSLWDSVTAIAETWMNCGQLPAERYGLTVAADGRHLLWSDDEHPANRQNTALA